MHLWQKLFLSPNMPPHSFKSTGISELCLHPQPPRTNFKGRLSLKPDVSMRLGLSEGMWEEICSISACVVREKSMPVPFLSLLPQARQLRQPPWATGRKSGMRGTSERETKVPRDLWASPWSICTALSHLRPSPSHPSLLHLCWPLCCSTRAFAPAGYSFPT